MSDAIAYCDNCSKIILPSDLADGNAVATALKTYPNFNATLDLELEEIIIKHYYHIGVAVNTAEGLIVPVIRDVDRKSIVELTLEMNDLVQRTRARKTTLEELQGGTCSLRAIGALSRIPIAHWTTYFPPVSVE